MPSTPTYLTPEQETTAKEFLAALRAFADGLPIPVRSLAAAALQICVELEARTHPDRLWSSGILAADLRPTHDLGEHLSATRRHFGLIP